MQAKGMHEVAKRTDAAASVSLMDLSVEAEAFGAEIRFSDDEVPAVVGAMIEDEKDIEKLEVPKVGTARTGICIDAIKKATALINDRPVFAGIIGPYSLAARLMDMQELMMLGYDDEDAVHTLVDKCAQFLINYAKAFKEAGADGIIMAEPVSGLLSPTLESEFSSPYVKKIIDAVQDDGFAVIYHNCGASAEFMTESIAKIGATAYHFGDALNMKLMVENMPADTVVMGNVSPSAEFVGGTPDSITAAVKRLYSECGDKPNFLLSSGCDIPPFASWENIDAFFKAAKETV
jgi:uroporphyrinogen decarboxylase